jgi:hypothetical protein
MFNLRCHIEKTFTLPQSEKSERQAKQAAKDSYYTSNPGHPIPVLKSHCISKIKCQPAKELDFHGCRPKPTKFEQSVKPVQRLPLHYPVHFLIDTHLISP